MFVTVQAATLEQHMVDSVHEQLEKLNVGIEHVNHNAPANVLDVHFRLPENADRVLRHDLLSVVSDFERDHDFGVIVNPTFLWTKNSDD